MNVQGKQVQMDQVQMQDLLQSPSKPLSNGKPSFNGGTLLVLVPALTEENKEKMLTSYPAILKTKYDAGRIFMMLEPNEPQQQLAQIYVQYGVVDGYAMLLDRSLETDSIVDNIIQWLNENNIQVDGLDILGSLHEYDIVKGILNDRLCLPGDGSSILKNMIRKDVTQDKVSTSPQASKYAVKSYSIRNEDDLTEALNHLSFPIVMKPLAGHGTLGVWYIANKQESQEYLQLVSNNLKAAGMQQTAMYYSNEYLAMEYVEGTLYNVTIAVHNGRLLGGVIVQCASDHNSSHDFYLKSAIRSMPGSLSTEKQCELINAAYYCLLAVGARTWIYNVEMIWQNNGVPKLVEINPRKGGYCIADFAKIVYDIDLELLGYLLNCKTASIIEQEFVAKQHIAGYIAFYHRDIAALQKSFPFLQHKHSSSEIVLYDFKRANSSGYSSTVHAIESGFKGPKACCLVFTSNINRPEGINKLADILVESTFFSQEEQILDLFR